MSLPEKRNATCLRCGWHVRAHDWIAADLVAADHTEETGHETTIVSDAELEFSKATEVGGSA
ncbi:hypothetical protein C453_03994 [Haloferax elongans ATCC BAA-1513]|uniref:Uncharacterized protein n=1 Tax=Haloferax elongans ATCC BAA-1513 TaxID=1230453 RepID=M0HUS1_HALEO|nr:hypothetical protein [Haloferax elongans]ELZ87483.1 hypothetical protein C453_03994 [Haloferax elongans ATCC BAA-1513]